MNRKASKRSNLSKRLWAIAISAIPYLIFAYVLFTTTENRAAKMTALQAQGVEVIGTITDKYTSSGYKGSGKYYHLNGRYRPEDGGYYLFRFDVTQEFYESIEVGDSVEVLYNPEHRLQNALKSAVNDYDAAVNRQTTRIVLFVLGILIILYWMFVPMEKAEDKKIPL